MQKTSKNILFISLIMGVVSTTYFFSLVASIPVVVATLLIVSFCAGTYFFLNKEQAVENKTHKLRFTLMVYGVVIIGLFLLVRGAYFEAEKYGFWDAWWFWNYHAKFLSRPDLWQEAYSVPFSGLLSSRVSHSDYPLMLPSTVGYFWRVLNTESTTIPFVIGFVFTCLIPLLIFFETYSKNLVVASIIFISIATHSKFIDIGVAQVADIVLSFFFLAAFVSLHHFRQSRLPVYLTYCGLMLGSCIWLKNEGLMLSLVFILFMFRDLLTWRMLSKFLLGLSPFLLAYIFFKIGYAPVNDIMAAQGPSTLSTLMDFSRYSVVWEGVKKSINEGYPETKAVLALYLFIGALQRNIHLKYLGTILVCLIGYSLAYIVSPHNTEWHVNTSIDRVLLHLIPATIYITLLKFSDLELRPLGKW